MLRGPTETTRPAPPATPHQQQAGADTQQARARRGSRSPPHQAGRAETLPQPPPTADDQLNSRRPPTALCTLSRSVRLGQLRAHATRRAFAHELPHRLLTRPLICRRGARLTRGPETAPGRPNSHELTRPDARLLLRGSLRLASAMPRLFALACPLSPRRRSPSEAATMLRSTPLSSATALGQRVSRATPHLPPLAGEQNEQPRQRRSPSNHPLRGRRKAPARLVASRATLVRAHIGHRAGCQTGHLTAAAGARYHRKSLLTSTFRLRQSPAKHRL